MHYSKAALIVAGIAAQKAIATGWTDASSYSCPSNTDNQCSDSQQGGYDWSGLDDGDFSSYGSNSFSGFKCSSSYGKRDLLTKRTFGSKVIEGGLDDQPSFSCDGSDSMSIDEMEISSSEDADVDCEYSMPDGSTCIESHSCSSGGSVFKNTQCGGAKSVTFKPGQNAPSGCSIGVHSVGFHCGPPSSTAPAYSSTPISTAPVSSVPVSSSAYPSSVPASSYGCQGPECSASPSSPASSSVPVSCAYGDKDCGSSTAPVSSAVPSSSYACTGPYCSDIPSGSSAYPISSSSYVPQPYPSSSSIPASSYECKGTGCSSIPVGTGYPSVPASSYGCQGPECSSTPSSPVSSSSSSAPPNYPTPNCPDLLPRCLNTWMFQSGCKSNDDKDCFCGNEEFINNVMGCISSWSESESDTQAAASYLMGICAAHVPENPAIITACPSTVTPVPSVPAYPQESVTSPVPTSAPAPSSSVPYPTTRSGQPPKPEPTAPCTTITYSSEATVPATYSTGPSQGYTMTGSSYTTKIVTTVTVPQVQFTTATVTISGTETSSVTLAAGTPSDVPAQTTPPAYGSSAAAVPSSYGTSFGTSFAPAPSASYGPVPATGEGVKLGSGFAGVALGAIVALAAL